MEWSVSLINKTSDTFTFFTTDDAMFSPFDWLYIYKHINSTAKVFLDNDS